MKMRTSLHRMSGFSLIEVMIAVVLVSVGLLGMALLQSTALRAGQSSSDRTTATMLTYQLLDMVRANRRQAASYNLIGEAAFTAAGDGRTGACAPNAVPPSLQWQADRDMWVCSAVRSLPEARGSVRVTAATAPAGGAAGVPTAGQITVTISWLDNRVTETRETFVVTTGL